MKKKASVMLALNLRARIRLKCKCLTMTYGIAFNTTVSFTTVIEILLHRHKILVKFIKNLFL